MTCLRPLLLALVLAPALRAAEPVVVTAGDQPLSEVPFLGFGVQWSAYPWFDITDDDWARVEKRLDFMRPPIVRLMTRAYKYCTGYDAAGKPVYDWNSPRMLKIYRLLDYCEKRKIEVILGEWDDPASDEDRQDPAGDKLQSYDIQETDPRWSVLICDMIEHLQKVKGYTCLKYYNLINEPNGSWSACGDFPKWKIAIENLHAEFKKRGLDRSLLIIGPDANSQKDYYWLDLSVLKMPGLIGVYDLHEYANFRDVESGWLGRLFHSKRVFVNKFDPQGAKKPFIMGEIGLSAGYRDGKPVQPMGGKDSQPYIYDFNYGVWMADFNTQVALAGMDATIAWAVDDAMHMEKSTNSSWPKLDNVTFKKWGFWNSMAEEIGHPDDAAIRPWFYTWSLQSRCFPRGCRFVEVPDPQRPGLRVAAARFERGATRHWSFVVVNDADEAREVVLRAPSAGVLPRLFRYHYFDQDRPVDPDGFPVVKHVDKLADPAAGLAVSLPSRGVVILTTLPPDQP